MSLFHDPVRSNLHRFLMEALGEICKTLENPPKEEGLGRELENDWTRPPKGEMGHASFPCFPLSKILRRPPVEIAKSLAQKMENDLEKCPWVKSVRSVGPYLNLFFYMEALAPSLLTRIGEGDFFRPSSKRKLPKTMIEYFSVNTHKEIHVGHLRNLCLGAAMVEIHRYLGYPVVTATYPGDSGTHVAKSLWYLRKEGPAPPREDRGKWLGEIYALAGQALEAEGKKDRALKENNRKSLAHILKEIGRGAGESFDLWKKTREWSLEHMREICDWARVDFDHWYFESELDIPSLEFVRRLYEEGKLIKDDGAIVMDLKEEKLGVCLLVKGDGNGLYATKDLELARQKFEDYGIQKNLYIVDKRQSLHFKQVFKTLEKIGYEEAKNCHHLEYEFVELPEGAISSRSGKVVSAQSLIQEIEETIHHNFLSRYKDWPKEERNRVAQVIGQGAIKYGMVSVDPNKKIVFHMNEWLRLDGESGPTIQYAHARIQSLLEKAPLVELSRCDFSTLAHPLEEALVVKLMDFNRAVESACAGYKVSLLASYLYDLAKLFNAFYGACPLLKAKTENLKNARLHLAHKVGLVLARGLGLLGIEAPRRM
ncbi:MAG: arginine--tRNA ligase [Bacteriovoracales bacterium]|nr:arginine--tRNA ligase [Bacteriovoracales bacterium]